jgi:hypothetical protein
MPICIIISFSCSCCSRPTSIQSASGCSTLCSLLFNLPRRPREIRRTSPRCPELHFPPERIKLLTARGISKKIDCFAPRGTAYTAYRIDIVVADSRARIAGPPPPPSPMPRSAATTHPESAKSRRSRPSVCATATTCRRTWPAAPSGFARMQPVMRGTLCFYYKCCRRSAAGRDGRPSTTATAAEGELRARLVHPTTPRWVYCWPAAAADVIRIATGYGCMPDGVWW